jgi:hypothetical protein
MNRVILPTPAWRIHADLAGINNVRLQVRPTRWSGSGGLGSPVTSHTGDHLESEQELEIAGWVAELVARLYEISPGSPTKRDGMDGSGLTNDFTFDDMDPRLAVEVTRLRDDYENPSPEERAGLEKRLRSFVANKEWPHWTVGVRPETKFRSDLEPAVQRMIDWMLAADLGTLGPGTYTQDVSADLIYRMGEGFMRDCDRARMAGVVLITKNAAGGLHVIPIVEFSDSKSLQRPLARAFERKTASLRRAKAKGYVTMLAVDVEREDTSGYLTEGTRAPGFPNEIDHVWLFVRGSSKVFHAKRDERRFRALDFPS